MRFSLDGRTRYRAGSGWGTLPTGTTCTVYITPQDERPYEVDNGWRLAGTSAAAVLGVAGLLASVIVSTLLYTGATMAGRSKVLEPLIALSAGLTTLALLPALRVSAPGLLVAPIGSTGAALLMTLGMRLRRAPSPSRPREAPEGEPRWTPTATTIVLANGLPLIGELFLGWTPFDALFIYWLEHLVVGVFLIAKLLAVRTSPGEWMARFYLVPFTVVHYFGFVIGHGCLLFAMFEGEAWRLAMEARGHSLLPVGALVDVSFEALGMLGLLALAPILYHHAHSFVSDYVGKGRHRTATTGGLMMEAVARVIIIHVALMAGGILLALAPSFLFAIFIAGKIVIELRLLRGARDLESGRPGAGLRTAFLGAAK